MQLLMGAHSRRADAPAAGVADPGDSCAICRGVLARQILSGQLSQGFDMQWIIIQAGYVVELLATRIEKNMPRLNINFLNGLQTI